MPGATSAAWGGATLTVLVSSVDVSCDVLACTVDRSQNRLWDPVDAGLCQVTIDISPDGQDTDAGPVGAPVVVNVAFGAVDRNLFTGEVQRRRLIHDPVTGDQLVLDCVDYFERLSRVNVRADVGDTAVGGGETPAQRIARWLNVVDSLSDRDLDSSTYTCPATQMDGNVLLQIQAAAFADGGVFFIDGDGVATFYAWAWRTEGGVVAAVFSDRRLHDWVPYSSATLTDDLDEVQNLVSGTRRAIDDEDVPVVQTVENTTSTALYGDRGDPLDNLELSTDEQVADRVTALVTIAGMPSPRFDSIVVQPAFDPSRSWPRVIPCTFGSLVAANRLWEDSTENAYYGHVIGELWRFTPDDATVEWRVSGTGAWDANGPPRPPVCIEITPEGLLRVCDGTPCNDIDEVIFRDCDGNQVGDTLPPGSLCGAGVEIPDGACEVCYQNEHGESCVDIQDPRLDALIWFDVRDEFGSALIERIDGDPIDPGPGLDSVDQGAIPGGNDAMIATDAGGRIGEGNGAKLGSTTLANGWTFDFWLFLPGDVAGETLLIDAGPVRLGLSTVFGPSLGFEVFVTDDLDVETASGIIAVPTLDVWQHWRIRWEPAGGNLITLVGGVFVGTDPFAAIPAAPSGDWVVYCPGGGSIGEVIVYGERLLTGEYDEAVLLDGPKAYWKLDTLVDPGASAYDLEVLGDGPTAYWKLDGLT